MIEHYFDCPHCWENQLKMIDPSIEEQNFIEDCEVCCNPIDFNIELKDGTITSFDAIQID